MNDLQVFNNDKFGKIRVLNINNEPWFVAADVCKILDLSNPTVALQRLDEDERSKFNLGRQGETNIVNEYGLYNLILASRKKEARQFKRWITHEVIPAIRKHGAYMTPDVIERTLSDPDFIIRLATQLKEERQARIEAEKKIALDKPKVIFADAVTASKTSILVGELAKLLRQNGIDIGQNRLFQWLRDNGYLIRRKGTDYNMPTQYSMELGLFEIKETTITHSDGHISISKTPKVTGKGQLYFINKFKEEFKSKEVAN
jgi:anti-repressor protein